MIIYHDFHLLVHVAGRSGKESTSHPSSEERYYKIAVKDLTMAQLNLLHFEVVFFVLLLPAFYLLVSVRRFKMSISKILVLVYLNFSIKKLPLFEL